MQNRSISAATPKKANAENNASSKKLYQDSKPQQIMKPPKLIPVDTGMRIEQPMQKSEKKKDIEICHFYYYDQRRTLRMLLVVIMQIYLHQKRDFHFSSWV